MVTTEKPLVSIIIPTLNEGKWLEKSLTLLRSTIRTPYEIIISDGKSTDKTLQIAKKLADKVVVHTKKHRQTIAEARNLGAKLAKGQYLIFIDTDVKITNPDHIIEKAIEKFEKVKKLGALSTKIAVYPEVETLPEKIIYAYLNAYHRIMNNLFNIGLAAGEFQMHRSSVFKKIKGFREDLVASEDYEIFYRISRKYKTHILSQFTIHHSGRRIKKVGWLRLLFIWTANAISMALKKRAITKEWKVIR